MNKLQRKIQKTSHKISIALKTGFIIMLVIPLLAAAGILILAFSSEAVRQSFLDAFNMTAYNGAIIAIVPQNLLVLFIFMIIYAVLMSFILHTAYTIFRDISMEYTPFKHKNIKRIKGIAAMTVILSAAGSFFDTIADIYMIGEASWHINFMGIILGIIIYCFALIFDYGCQLQLQSDETL